jgi:hypothetical protein
MIAVIRIAPFGLFYYWQKPVMNRLGRSCQYNSFIAVISTRERSALASERYRVASEQIQSTDYRRLHHCGHSNPHSIPAH